MTYTDLQLVIGGGIVALVAFSVLTEGMIRKRFHVAAFPFHGLMVRPAIAIPIYAALFLGGVLMVMKGVGWLA